MSACPLRHPTTAKAVESNFHGRRSTKFSDHYYFAHDCLVEGGKLFCGNPIFQMINAASLFRAIVFEKAASHLEAGDKPRAAGWHIPVAGDFDGIFFGQNRVKDGLLGKA